MKVFTASKDVYFLCQEDKERIKRMVRKTNCGTINVYFNGTVLVHEMKSSKSNKEKVVERVDFDSVFDEIRNHRSLLKSEYNLSPEYEKREILSNKKVDLNKKC